MNPTHMNPHMISHHQNTILLERHYIPYNLYCNMYNYPNHQSYNNFNIPNNSLFTHNNPINARYNLFNSQTIPNNINQRTNNEEINIRRPIIPNPLPYTLSSNLTDPSIYNRNNLYNIPIPIPIPLNTSNINTVHTETNTSNLNINRILNEVINDIPYNFEFNNRFGTIGSGGFIGTITTTNLNNSNNDTLQEEGIPLSNINLITNVARFCDIQNNNNVDTCSICQLAFSNTIICRVINNCNHIFHINCIDTWLHNHTTCPFCRYDLSNISISNQEENDNEEEEDYEEGDYEEGDYEEGDYEEEDYEEGDYEEGDYEETEGGDYEESNEENINQSQSNNTTNNTTDPIINTEPMLNDINTFVSMSTPFINSFINQRVPNSNASSTINSEQINRQINNSVNQFVNQLNPLLQSFNNFGNRN